MNEVYEFLKKCGVYYLATIDDNKPKVRPFGTIDMYNGKLYIQTGKVKDVANQMKTNSNVELSGMYEDKWIRVSAQVVLDESIEAQKHMLDSYPSLQGMYKAGDGNTEVYYLKNVTAQICSFSQEPKIIEF